MYATYMYVYNIKYMLHEFYLFYKLKYYVDEISCKFSFEHPQLQPQIFYFIILHLCVSRACLHHLKCIHCCKVHSCPRMSIGSTSTVESRKIFSNILQEQTEMAW